VVEVHEGDEIDYFMWSRHVVVKEQLQCSRRTVFSARYVSRFYKQDKLRVR
jgi:hypothetical protein